MSHLKETEKDIAITFKLLSLLSPVALLDSKHEMFTHGSVMTLDPRDQYVKWS